MADQPGGLPHEAGDSAVNQPGLQGAIARFKALPKNVKLALGGLAVFFVLMFLLRSGGDEPLPPPVVAPQAAVADQNQPAAPVEGEDGAFAPVDANRESLRRGFISQQQLALSRLRQDVQTTLDDKVGQLDDRLERIGKYESQLQETVHTLTDQMRVMEETNTRQREEISRLAEEMRRQGGRAPTGAGAPSQAVPRKPRQKITQVSLGGGGGVGGQALLQGVAQTAGAKAPEEGNKSLLGKKVDETIPFIPPLGFVKGTLLNGVDALASSGIATPALVRLKGVYKTAMNSTVILDGCFMLVEFEGDISTERAKGKPSRMTCVYPDRGAVTYDVTGYLVDAEDGVEGVPGVFFEGDSGRIALAIAAQFASGVAQIIQQNQTTNVTNSDGTNTQFMTGSDSRAAVAGGTSAALNRLTDYLVERAERIAPFIRIDAMRDVHIVLLSGTELRKEGNAWSLLFNADSSAL